MVEPRVPGWNSRTGSESRGGDRHQGDRALPCRGRARERRMAPRWPPDRTGPITVDPPRVRGFARGLRGVAPRPANRPTLARRTHPRVEPRPDRPAASEPIAPTTISALARGRGATTRCASLGVMTDKGSTGSPWGAMTWKAEPGADAGAAPESRAGWKWNQGERQPCGARWLADAMSNPPRWTLNHLFRPSPSSNSQGG